MALSYENQDKATTTDAFLGRIRAACRHYANYLISGTPTPEQLTWANAVFGGGYCAQKAANMAGQVIQDAAFANATDANFGTDPSIATDVSDSALQSAVEKVCMTY